MNLNRPIRNSLETTNNIEENIVGDGPGEIEARSGDQGGNQGGDPGGETSPPAALRDRLRRRIAAIERLGKAGSTSADRAAPLPFGVASLDRHLPWGGLMGASVHEIIDSEPIDSEPIDSEPIDSEPIDSEPIDSEPTDFKPMGGAATAFAVALLGRLQRRSRTARPMLWIAPRHAAHETLYGPGLAFFGFDPFDPGAGLVLVRARGMTQILWAMEECLRAGPVGAVVAELPAGALPDLTAGRRLQLAAEAGGTLGLLLHAENAAASALPPSACVTRWRIAPTAGPLPPPPPPPPPPIDAVASAATGPPLFAEAPRWRVELMRCRGGAPGAWELEWAAGGADATNSQTDNRTSSPAPFPKAGGFRLVAPLSDRPDLPASEERHVGDIELAG